MGSWNNYKHFIEQGCFFRIRESCRGTQREKLTIGVGTPFLGYKGPFVVRFKGLFLNAEKNLSVRIR